MSAPRVVRGGSTGAWALKVCCIQDESELRAAVDAGADFAGLVGAMPSGPGPLDDARIAALASAAKGIRPVLLTARAGPEDIAEHVRATGVRAVQVVRPVTADVRRALKRALPGVELIQVVHVEGPSSIEQARKAAEGADYLLLDSGRPSARVAELGGTGRVHDWDVSARIVEVVGIPVLLAGGLRRDNVAEAVRTVRPWGVDVCSGLRDAEGRLVADELRAFVYALEGAAPPRTSG